MYNPPRFKSENIKEAIELMDKYPFATVVSLHEDKSNISHLPLVPKLVGDRIELIGHMARANSHWKSLEKSITTVIFHGPHTFITPKWYAKNDVPTWNYSAVHVNGKIELIEDHDGIIECLKQLTDHTEKHWPSGWEFFVPDNLSGGVLAKSIVGFKIIVDQINFKKKLSQNRSALDRAGILNGLESRSDENSHLVLGDMMKLYTQNGEDK